MGCLHSKPGGSHIDGSSISVSKHVSPRAQILGAESMSQHGELSSSGIQEQFDSLGASIQQTAAASTSPHLNTTTDLAAAATSIWKEGQMQQPNCFFDTALNTSSVYARNHRSGDSSEADTQGVTTALRRVESASSSLASRWEQKQANILTFSPEEILSDVCILTYLGNGGCSTVFKARWHSSTVALKLFSSTADNFHKSAAFHEAFLGQELSHPNLVRYFETRCARLSPEFVKRVMAHPTPIRFHQGSSPYQLAGTAPAATPLHPAPPLRNPAPPQQGTAPDGAPTAGGDHAKEELPFVSGDGFGPPDGVAYVSAPPAATAPPSTWGELLRLVHAGPGDYLTLVLTSFCDLGDLGTAIARGVFRTQATPTPVGSSRQQAEGLLLRYRGLLHTAREVAQGLHHLHKLDVVHGGLRPSSVMLQGSRKDRRGFTAQLIRYGHSRVVEGSRHKSTSPKGSTQYMAPEQFAGQLSKACDVYAFGMLLWQMAAGEEPYKGLTQGGIVVGVSLGTLRPAWPAQQDVGGTTDALRELFTRCVAQEPSARPKAGDVMAELLRIELALRAELAAAAAAGAQAGAR